MLLGVNVVENNGRPTQPGGVTGAGFRPGQSGNPGGRPKGLRRRVQELVGPDGDAIVAYMVEVMQNPVEKTRDRMDAARWLADRGFGKAVPEVDWPLIPEWIDMSKLSDKDLQVMIELCEKAWPEDRYPRHSRAR
jgi:hypothetical protein